MSYLRTNYRLTGNMLDDGALQSQWIKVRQTAQLGSATSGYVTLSIGQVPALVMVNVLPTNKQRQAEVINASISGSLVLVSFVELSAAGSIGMNQGSMAATTSYAFEVMALVGSR